MGAGKRLRPTAYSAMSEVRNLVEPAIARWAADARLPAIWRRLNRR